MSICPILVNYVVLQYYNSIINDHLILITKITNQLQPFETIQFLNFHTWYKDI